MKVLNYYHVFYLSHISLVLRISHSCFSLKKTEDLCDELGNFAVGDFPTHTEKPAFGVYGLMGNGARYMEQMEKLSFFLYRHPTEGNVMSDWNECVPSAVKEAMATMNDMGPGMPSELDILAKTRRFLVHAVTLGSIMITVNSCGFNKAIFKKYMKDDCEVKNRDTKNDGLFNKLFPPYASSDAATIRQDFNLLKQVMPNGENMARLCMIGYTRSNYGNLYCLVRCVFANLSAKEAEYILDKETTGKLNAKPRNSQQYLKIVLEDIAGEYSTCFLFYIFYITEMIHLPFSHIKSTHLIYLRS